MQFETSANSWIRPSVGHRPQPAYAVAAEQRQTASLDASGETGAGDIQTGKLTEESLGFEDLLDVVNPLQHIPIVSNLYREMTGDEISAPARILGGFLFGGPVGLVASAVNAIAEEATGRDLGEAAIATLFGDETDPTAVAETATQTASLDGAGEPSADVILGVLPSPKTSGVHAPPPPDVTTAAAAPSSDNELLTGEAALDALAQDLGVRNSAPAASAAPATINAANETAATAKAPPAEAVTGVPANLIGIGTRDRRGLAPLQARLRMPMPTDRLPNRLPGAASAPSGQPLVSTPLPQAVDDANAAGNADFSVQLLDALKKYENMMQKRKSGA